MRRENSIGFTYGGIGRTEYAAGDKAEREGGGGDISQVGRARAPKNCAPP